MANTKRIVENIMSFHKTYILMGGVLADASYAVGKTEYETSDGYLFTPPKFVFKNPELKEWVNDFMDVYDIMITRGWKLGD